MKVNPLLLMWRERREGFMCNNIKPASLTDQADKKRKFLSHRFEFERKCWDPKDGELCLNRLKSDESLMEDRSVCDVQIHRQIWV